MTQPNIYIPTQMPAGASSRPSSSASIPPTRKWKLNEWLNKRATLAASGNPDKVRQLRHKHTNEIFNTCARFMEEECASRPSTHGSQHMHEVAKLAEEIAIEEGREDLVVAVLVVGVLHDYADSKYDSDGSLNDKLIVFLNSTFDIISAAYILRCTELISYSKEALRREKYGHKTAEEWQTDLIDWVNELGPIWTQIRNIVSDADKLLASGRDGFQRTFEYKAEAYASKHNGALIPDDLRREQMFEIYINRLSKTHTHLMHTAAGRKRAVVKFHVMEGIADRYFAGYPPYSKWKFMMAAMVASNVPMPTESFSTLESSMAQLSVSAL